MTDAEIAALVGRSDEAEDFADPHRWRAYRTFFRLGEEEPALAVHSLLFSRLATETRADGHATAMHPFPPLPWPRRMWAGGELRWRQVPREGEALTRGTAITRAERKQGGSGAFLLASLSHEIRGDAGAAIDERHDLVFLPEATRRAAVPRPLEFEPVWAEDASFDAVGLFRYSALTLNSHRIHYDADYARDVEHYPGIVVHGPLLATRLMHAASRRSGRTPALFSYRAVAPAFAGEPLRLVGRGADLAVVDANGALRMRGTVGFDS